MRRRLVSNSLPGEGGARPPPLLLMLLLLRLLLLLLLLLLLPMVLRLLRCEFRLIGGRVSSCTSSSSDIPSCEMPRTVKSSGFFPLPLPRRDMGVGFGNGTRVVLLSEI